MHIRLLHFSVLVLGQKFGNPCL